MSDKLHKMLRVQHKTSSGKTETVPLTMDEDNLKDLQKKVDLALRVIAREKAKA